MPQPRLVLSGRRRTSALRTASPLAPPLSSARLAGSGKGKGLRTAQLCRGECEQVRDRSHGLAAATGEPAHWVAVQGSLTARDP